MNIFNACGNIRAATISFRVTPLKEYVLAVGELLTALRKLNQAQLEIVSQKVLEQSGDYLLGLRKRLEESLVGRAERSPRAVKILSGLVS